MAISPRRWARGFSLVELMIVVTIIGTLASIAIPNFVKFQARSKQAEPRAVLRGYYQSQRAYFGEMGTYSSTLSNPGFAPERGNRYAYLVALTPTSWQSRATATPATSDHDGLEVDCFAHGGGCVPQPARTTALSFSVTYPSSTTGPADTGFVAGLTGNIIMEARGSIDNDAAPDVWFISSGNITVANTTCSVQDVGVPGAPVHAFNDVACE